MKMYILIILFVLISCGTTLTGQRYPDPNVYRVDYVYCWKNIGGHWRAIGLARECPSDTKFLPDPPRN